MLQRLTLSVSALILLVYSCAAAADLPQPKKVDRPVFRVNDTWTYRINDRSSNGETKERRWVISIIRSSSTSILQSAKAVDSSMPPIEKLRGTDLSQTASINGKEVIVHKPFDFPLEVGKEWEISYERKNPTKAVKRHEVKLQYTGH